MNFDTIFALSSGAGKSGVAVIRISGDNLIDIFKRIIHRDDITPRHAYLAHLIDNGDNLIDQVVAIYFNAPHSFTGTDVIEIHSHGAPAVIQKIFEWLYTLGMRMASPGEFSKRAFYNNKMDLSEIDGLAALLDAQTDRQRANALKSMTGSDSAAYESWRSQMIEISAYAAAMMDYPADELPANINDKLITQTQKLHDDINNAMNGYERSHAIRHGFNIVLTGDPNVGKSSLFNRLVGESRAIVSDIPGTTRDVISATLDIDGYLVNLFDTAGIRDAMDEIEEMGIAKSFKARNDADLIIHVYAQKSDKIEKPSANEIIVINKCDVCENRIDELGYVLTSAMLDQGINDLLNVIKSKIHNTLDSTESQISINERTRELLRDTVRNLDDALGHANISFDIFAEYVRRAADSIGRILGTIDAGEIADATFGQLCLGK
ncbi:tRNA uridine-5-carboxymethylaminomethyl(34) synthesis GTPase MnmE [Lachnospiraceae bacterium OttesenSCG-928-E19]|nr:tRNA uridine-5-carboxymethylaminomethyl(34) synthesis GTPase MnmE [Lachnospiraceae bacterium OttesenSCG-928-E19]